MVFPRWFLSKTSQKGHYPYKHTQRKKHGAIQNPFPQSTVGHHENPGTTTISHKDQLTEPCDKERACLALKRPEPTPPNLSCGREAPLAFGEKLMSSLVLNRTAAQVHGACLTGVQRGQGSLAIFTLDGNVMKLLLARSVGYHHLLERQMTAPVVLPVCRESRGVLWTKLGIRLQETRRQLVHCRDS